MKPARRHFFPGIQGLRAVAVLLVLFYHVWPESVSGGFIGVDVFFVLSGYLMTGLLIREAATGRMDLLAFWARRIRRLLPAATAVLLVCLILSWTLLPETKRTQVADDVVWASLYIVNWRYALLSTDYGQRGEGPSPVQHYWSLSIEEQFYIVWPVMAALIARFVSPIRQRRAFSLLTACFCLASFFYSVHFTATGSAAAYFSSGTRIWEIAAGAFFASLRIRLGAERLAGILNWVGLLLIVASGLLLTTSMPFPGWLALFPVSGTVLMLLSDRAPRWSPLYILKWKPLQYVGDISYSVYLWHWPVVLFLPDLAGDASVLADGPALVLLSLLAGMISKTLIEDPFRSGRFSLLLSRLDAVALGAVLVMISAGSALGLKHEQQEKEHLARIEALRLVSDKDYPGAAALDPENPAVIRSGLPVRPDPLLAKKDRPVLYTDGCDAKQTHRAVACHYGNAGMTGTLVLLGDSHGAQYLPALRAIAERKGWRIVVYQKSACMVSDSVVRFRSTGRIREDCEGWKREALKAVLRMKPDLVITSTALPDIYNEYYRLAPTEELVQGYRSLWQSLTAAGIPVLVIRDNPRPEIDIPSCVVLNRSALQRCSLSKEQVLDRHEDPLVQASDLPMVSLLDLTPFLCNETECPAVIGNVLVYRDGDHLTATFVRSLAPYIEKKIDSLSGEQSRPGLLEWP